MVMIIIGWDNDGNDDIDDGKGFSLSLSESIRLRTLSGYWKC